MPRGSVTVRRSLGRRLRALRLAASKTQADVATVASPAKLRRIESGKGPIRMADVRTLCFMYDAGPTETEYLVALSLNTEEGWWEDYLDVMPGWFNTYVELESVASEISTYEADVVPGLLQTADYARAVFLSGQRRLSVETADRLVVARTKRQENVFAKPGVRINVILGAGVLLRQVGGPEVIGQQLAHLHRLNERIEVELRVLTWQAGAHAAMEGPFTLLHFKESDDPTVTYIETHAGARYLESEPQVLEYRDIFDRTWNQSAPLEEYVP